MDKEPDGVAGIVLHEYLHHLDARFKDVGVPSFYDPDGKPAGSPMSNMAFYQHTMRHLEQTNAPPPYGLLNGIFGTLR